MITVESQWAHSLNECGAAAAARSHAVQLMKECHHAGGAGPAMTARPPYQRPTAEGVYVRLHFLQKRCPYPRPCPCRPCSVVLVTL